MTSSDQKGKKGGIGGVVGKGYKWVRKGKRIKNKKKEVWKVVREGEG